MAVLTRHARLLYLLALFQLLGGPLVLGGLMMVKRFMTRQDLSLSQSISLTLERMNQSEPRQAFMAAVETSAEWQIEGRGVPQPTKPGVPVPKKIKEAKDKLWVVNDLTQFLWQSPQPELMGQKGWHDPVPKRLAHAPPIPPPRWS